MFAFCTSYHIIDSENEARKAHPHPQHSSKFTAAQHLLAVRAMVR